MGDVRVMSSLASKKSRPGWTAESNCTEVIDHVDSFCYDTSLHVRHVVHGTKANILVIADNEYDVRWLG